MKQENTAKTTIPEVIQKALVAQNIDPDDVNLLLPTKTYGQMIGQYERLTIETVDVDPNLSSGDVYEVTKGRLSLCKRPLAAMSSALGIVWDPVTTGIVVSADRKSRAKATGAMMKPNGDWLPYTDEKTVDLDAIEEEQRIKQEEYAAEGFIVEWKTSQNGKRYPVREPWEKHGGEKAKHAYIDLEVRKAVVAYWKFKDERANTGARERVIKFFLALKNSYTAEELKKPIAFPCITIDAKKILADPEMKQIALDRMTGSVKAIFGGPTGSETKQLEHKPHYEVADNGSGAKTEEEPAEEPAEKEPEEVVVPWDDEPKETGEEEQLREAVEDIKERRKKYDKNLPKNAKSFIDDIIARGKYDFETISALRDRMDEFEKRAREMGVTA